MGSAVSKNNKDYINNNWNSLKCSPIGPFLQMSGMAPGNASETSSKCKSSEFSSQFNSSMNEYSGNVNQLSKGLNSVNSSMNKFRGVIASIEQRAFEDISRIATQIFKIYVKIGNIFYVIIKNLINIMTIFKNTVDVGASIAKLLISFINLLREPINGLIDFISFFSRGI